MDDQPLSHSIEDARERSLAEDLRQLADDGKAYAEAELAFQKSRAALAGKGIKGIVIFGVLAAMLVFFALMALTIGLVLALTPLLTPWGAAAASFAGLLVLAGICAMLVGARYRRTRRFISGGDRQK